MYSHLNEPEIMKRLNKYSLGMKLISSFKDYDNIYLVTTYYEGKTLDNYKDENLSEDKIQFISACIIQTLIYFRKEKIIHRDIDLKNIISDKDNYFNIIDFSSSIEYKDKNNHDYYIRTGPNVAPPEMINNKKYFFNSDYYRFGSIIFYLIFKQYPNVIKKEKKIKQLSIDYREIKNYSNNCIDFLNKLIITEPRKRIGYKDINEMKKHPWFNDFNWKKFENKQIQSPFNFSHNDSNKYFECPKFNVSYSFIKRYRKTTKRSIYNYLIKHFEFYDISIFKAKIDFKNLKKIL